MNETIQLVINTSLLREIDERKLINAYARFEYNSDEDVTNDTLIRSNLVQLLDWDINGDKSLGIYCGKFESIKERDWIRLIQFIKNNRFEIETLSKPNIKERDLENIKVINSFLEAKEERNKKRFSDENYKVSGRGKKAKICIYEGRKYKSRQECIYKEGLTKHQLYEYLKKTNQL